MLYSVKVTVAPYTIQWESSLILLCLHSNEFMGTRQNLSIVGAARNCMITCITACQKRAAMACFLTLAVAQQNLANKLQIFFFSCTVFAALRPRRNNCSQVCLDRSERWEKRSLENGVIVIVGNSGQEIEKVRQKKKKAPLGSVWHVTHNTCKTICKCLCSQSNNVIKLKIKVRSLRPQKMTYVYSCCHSRHKGGGTLHDEWLTA